MAGALLADSDSQAADYQALAGAPSAAAEHGVGWPGPPVVHVEDCVAEQ